MPPCRSLFWSSGNENKNQIVSSRLFGLEKISHLYVSQRSILRMATAGKPDLALGWQSTSRTGAGPSRTQCKHGKLLGCPDDRMHCRGELNAVLLARAQVAAITFPKDHMSASAIQDPKTLSRDCIQEKAAKLLKRTTTTSRREVGSRSAREPGPVDAHQLRRRYLIGLSLELETPTDREAVGNTVGNQVPCSE